MELAARALRTVRKHGLVPRGGRVLVAFSGGPDSVALLHVLRELERDGEVAVAGLAHFNHQLRGAAADGDEQFCRAVAAELDIPFEAGRGDVRAFARERGRSIEDAARTLRYEFLEAAAARLRADVIAVGHSLDDQAETFLLRLIRGAGPRGLGAIRPRAGRVVRPLIEIPRPDLRAYVAARGLMFREDATNEQVAIPRNRVRHELIPYLEREFSPGIVDVLAREAAIARDDEDHLQAEAIKFAASIVLDNKVRPDNQVRLKPDTTIDRDTTIDKIELDSEALRSLPPAMATRVARIALEKLAGGRFIGFDHIDTFLDFARTAKPGAALSLPGQQAVHRDRLILLQHDRGALKSRVRGAGKNLSRRRAEADGNSFQFPLSIPGEVILTTQGWAVSAEPLHGDPPAGGWRAGGDVVAVASAAVQLPLGVRSRRAGDRFRPLGMTGGKKLQDFLVDRKIPREMRDSLPLVVDATDRIVWVVGQSVAEDFRVTEPSTGVILLKARRLGGQG